ncbi:1,2-phenylacetyl-CoA epoxidase subunit PaaE [Flavisolibacter ginsenosidimutans]|uniref:Phenylacetate-CoA oxygenase/reductase subunit PaaK n=1 Tax=Flavisolibacter ginsenosidimutans TaxID=661481 RepID=A0A5B8UNZ6_9BACT|nr:1,2-phenylacetyl-CoA epoxidase subunit PaaE [Flavisolibacter ginsenosidimutans]QEC57675.1 phenylacetate-CoA oxygenase/reductase subunit PaaK [Flavisolibacter ginsenosidimutans]
MIHFHPLRVKKVEKETDDCVSIEFDVPAELQETFRFKQGQNLTIKKWLNGEELRRNYSICTSPFDNKLKVAVKKAEGGLFSTFANDELKAGDVLDVLPPTGKFYTDLHPSNKKSYVAFAAGSGITPVLSIVKTTLLTEPQSNFALVYGNRTKSNIIFKEELEALKDKFIDRLRVYHILSREKTDAELNYGRIDVPKLELVFSKVIDAKACDEFFLCGPEEMIFCIKGYLEGRGIAPDKIHFELFTVPGQKQSAISNQQSAIEDKSAKAKISVKVDGILFDFDLAYESESILDAALKQGADLPYACKGGVCTTCKAKLVEGEVSMDVNWGLEPEEVAQGYVLTCQSHPKTEKVVVDFDAK